MNYFSAAFRNYANFSDRATRSQFWMFFLIYMIISIMLAIAEVFIGIPALTFIWSIVMLIPTLSYGARRLHDTGLSGWWQLLTIIPVVGIIIVIIMFAMPAKDEAAERFPPQKT